MRYVLTFEYEADTDSAAEAISKKAHAAVGSATAKHRCTWELRRPDTRVGSSGGVTAWDGRDREYEFDEETGRPVGPAKVIDRRVAGCLD